MSPRATFAALLWCLLLLSLHVVLGGAACTYGDPVCVHNDQKDFLYRGVLVGAGPKRLQDTRFSVRFASRLPNPPISGFVTDAQGRFCIRWAEEGGATTFYAGNEPVRAIPENPPFPPPKVSGPSPPGCQSSDAGIPWYHTSDPTGTPAFLSVTVLGLLSAGLLLAGLLLGARVVGAPLRVAGVGLTLATTALAAFVWFVLPRLA